jgi:hypothetical protein
MRRRIRTPDHVGEDWYSAPRGADTGIVRAQVVWDGALRSKAISQCARCRPISHAAHALWHPATLYSPGCHRLKTRRSLAGTRSRAGSQAKRLNSHDISKRVSKWALGR